MRLIPGEAYPDKNTNNDLNPASSSGASIVPTVEVTSSENHYTILLVSVGLQWLQSRDQSYQPPYLSAPEPFYFTDYNISQTKIIHAEQHH